MKGIFLILGTNLGDKGLNLKIAADKLREKKVNICSVSKLYETSPWGGMINQSDYWNILLEIAIEKNITPLDLLKICLEIENEMGRERIDKWGDRIIDIDILYFYDEIINTPQLKIPHPYIQDRKFTLTLLCDLCPNEIHPILKQAHSQLLEKCKDQGICKLISL